MEDKEKQTLFLFLVFLAILIAGCLIGRFFGINEANNYHRREEVIKENCEIYAQNQEFKDNLNQNSKYALDLNFTVE